MAVAVAMPPVTVAVVGIMSRLSPFSHSHRRASRPACHGIRSFAVCVVIVPLPVKQRR